MTIKLPEVTEAQEKRLKICTLWVVLWVSGFVAWNNPALGIILLFAAFTIHRTK